jgi:hypothetical protein
LTAYYEPQFGEYPDIDGDQAIFWVYNDKGNIHTESGGDAIGVRNSGTRFWIYRLTMKLTT